MKTSAADAVTGSTDSNFADRRLVARVTGRIRLDLRALVEHGLVATARGQHAVAVHDGES